MPPAARRDLELEEDLRFMQINWRIERAGWVVMLLVVLAALAGLFGNGPLARGQAGASGDPLSIRYPRIARLRSPIELRIAAQPPFPHERLDLFLSDELLDGLTIERWMPEPHTLQPVSGGLLCSFETSSAPASVRIVGQFTRAGRVRGTIGRADQPALTCHTFVFP